MPERSLTRLLEGGAFFEAPRWHEGRWWVSDFYRHAVYTVSPQGREELVVEVEHQPSGLGWMPDGSLLIVSMKDQRVLKREQTGTVTVHSDLSAFTDSPLNDMVVDSGGRAWVGVLRVRSDGVRRSEAGTPDARRSRRHRDPGRRRRLMFPNGSVITPDGKTLIVGETAGCRYTAFTMRSDGSLTDRRVWAQLAPTPELAPLQEMLPQIAVGPDGCTLDAQRHIWAADEAGARCIRIALRRGDRGRDPHPRGVRLLRLRAGW